ncbi:ribosomal protein S7 domain-containing protein [Obelidium mucronatum]|nr:ribosomal protein S7 domain-containing protein [Obelidium mucronatum]
MTTAAQPIGVAEHTLGAAIPAVQLRVPSIESPLISAFVNNIMKDGKKATARRIVNDALKHIQVETSSDPHQIMANAVEKVEPLFKVVGVKKGAKSMLTPKPLTERQRRRTAIIWIIGAAESRNQKDPAGIRIGKELLAILSDESSTIQKRNQVHKTALQNRSNVVLVDRRIRKM